jgi:hypothetical protein
MCKLTLAFLFTRSSASWGAQQFTDEQIRQTLITRPLQATLAIPAAPTTRCVTTAGAALIARRANRVCSRKMFRKPWWTHSGRELE